MNLIDTEKQIRIAMENALKSIQICQIELNRAFRGIDDIRSRHKEEKSYLKLVK